MKGRGTHHKIGQPQLVQGVRSLQTEERSESSKNKSHKRRCLRRGANPPEKNHTMTLLLFFLYERGGKAEELNCTRKRSPRKRTNHGKGQNMAKHRVRGTQGEGVLQNSPIKPHAGCTLYRESRGSHSKQPRDSHKHNRPPSGRP